MMFRVCHRYFDVHSIGASQRVTDWRSLATQTAFWLNLVLS